MFKKYFVRSFEDMNPVATTLIKMTLSVMALGTMAKT